MTSGAPCGSPRRFRSNTNGSPKNQFRFSTGVFYRAGLYYPIASKLELSGDLGYFHIENFENEDAETPERMYSLQARINLEYKFKSRISFFTSGGYGMTRYYDKNKFYEKKPIFEAGVILF